MSSHRDLARRKVRAAMTHQGWTPTRLAREAGVDNGTVADFLSGERWPQARVQGKLERALGWPAGAIADLADGLDPAAVLGEADVAEENPRSEVEPTPAGVPSLSVVPSTVDASPDDDEDDVDNEVLGAILRDPELDEIAREHFTKQYKILREFSRFRRGTHLLPYVAHGQRQDPVDPAEEARIEEEARRAARENPHSPNGDK